MELKFRAWHKERKLYYKVTRLDFRKYLVKYLVEFYNHLDYVYERIDTNKVIIEQYTGLKDKNGKEIYVGDIVKYTHDWEVYGMYNKISAVIYENGGFSPMQMANGGTYYGLESKPIYEVIGNIHENKYLIEEGM